MAFSLDSTQGATLRNWGHRRPSSCEAALKQAAVNGLAASNKGNGELAIAFRPDLLAAYLGNLESLHDCGRLPTDFDVLERVAQDPEGVHDGEVVQEIEDESRRYAVLATKRALRDGSFRRRVLTAYGQRCAMCGIQLKLLDSAHILPARDPRSTDQTHNGVALCALHHRGYDNALVTFDAGFETHLNDSMLDNLRAENLVGELDRFKRELRPVLWLPPDRRDRPLRDFVEMANEQRGWRL